MAVEGNFLWLPENDNQARAFSDGGPTSTLLARPFFNANTNVQDADPIAVPNVMAGEVRVFLPRQVLGSELNLRFSQPYSIYSFGRLVCLTGFRWLSLQEGLQYTERLRDLPGLGQPGNEYTMDESFRVSNHFYGGQIGLGYDSQFGPWTLEFLGKLALGNNSQSVRARATTQIREPNGTVTRSTDRGLLVQPSNAGSWHRNEFAFIPELNINLCYVFNDNVRVTLGYTGTYWSKVIHPEGQIDNTVNIQALQPIDQVGPARQGRTFNSEDFWMQGFSLGLQFNF